MKINLNAISYINGVKASNRDKDNLRASLAKGEIKIANVHLTKKGKFAINTKP